MQLITRVLKYNYILVPEMSPYNIYIYIYITYTYVCLCESYVLTIDLSNVIAGRGLTSDSARSWRLSNAALLRE